MDDIEIEIVLSYDELELDFQLETNITVIPQVIPDLTFGGPEFIQ